MEELNNIKRLADLDKRLWSAFTKSEKSFLPPTLNPFRAIETTIHLVKSKHLSAIYNYVIYLVLALIFAGAAIFYSFYFFIPYLVFLALTIVSRAKYIVAYATEKLGESNFPLHGFGIENPALTVAGVMRIQAASQTTPSKDELASLIKIVKSSQELSDVTFGVAEYLKKSLYALPLAAMLAVQQNIDTIRKYVDLLGKSFGSDIAAQILLAAMFIGVSFIVYDIVLGKTLEKRQKKKYLLVLNVMHEIINKNKENLTPALLEGMEAHNRPLVIRTKRYRQNNAGRLEIRGSVRR